jgi:hypothetical protein
MPYSAIVRTSARFLILALSLLASCASPTTKITTTAQLLAMSNEELDTLFRRTHAGSIPNGEGEGTAIIKPGSSISDDLARFIHRFAWKGKVFDATKGELRNKILPRGHKAIVAKVYKDKSWLDQKECIVLDYSKTSLVAHWVRDEIREIAPGIYLGIVYWGKKELIHFALEFPAANGPRANPHYGREEGDRSISRAR